MATCLKLPEPDPDQGPLLEALGRRGLRAEMLAWDGPAAEADGFDLCIVRSTWNYPPRFNKFFAWLERTASRTRLLNPLPVLDWNLHKMYLADLGQSGVPILPTSWMQRSPTAHLRDLLDRRGWREFVVKPCISAASFHTRRFSADEFDAANEFLTRHLRRRDMMVQQYMPSVETIGERSLIWIDGEFTHAIRKAPRYAGGQERISEAEALTDEDHRFGEQVMGCLEGDLLYARVDIIRDDDGNPCLSELELIEPSLFLLQHPPALERFADAITHRARVK